jgi:hypothetical protein
MFPHASGSPPTSPNRCIYYQSTRSGRGNVGKALHEVRGSWEIFYRQIGTSTIKVGTCCSCDKSTRCYDHYFMFTVKGIIFDNEAEYHQDFTEIAESLPLNCVSAILSRRQARCTLYCNQNPGEGITRHTTLCLLLFPPLPLMNTNNDRLPLSQSVRQVSSCTLQQPQSLMPCHGIQ